MTNYFPEHELKCKHTGIYKFDQKSLDLYNQMREEAGFPWPVSSGYRHPTHPIEVEKDSPGSHSVACAIDVLCYGERYTEILKLAIKYGIQRVGSHQRGPLGQRFIHLDTIGMPGFEHLEVEPDRFPVPWGWTY